MKFKMCQGQEPQLNCRCVGDSLFEEMAHRSQYGLIALTEKDLKRYVGGEFYYRQSSWGKSKTGKNRVYITRLQGKILEIEASFPVISITHKGILKKEPRKKWSEVPELESEFVFVMNGWTSDSAGGITLKGDDPATSLVLYPPGK